MRPSSIDKLETPIREQINRLRIDSGYTIEQIVGHLKAMDIVVSKSAMGRHVQKLEVVGARIKEARAIAEGIAPQLADDGKVAALNLELLHSAVMQLLSNTEDDGEARLNPSQAMMVGKALESAAKAQKLNADRVLKVRKETAEKAAKTVERELKKTPGLSADTIAEIRHKVLGVAE